MSQAALVDQAGAGAAVSVARQFCQRGGKIAAAGGKIAAAGGALNAHDIGVPRADFAQIQAAPRFGDFRLHTLLQRHRRRFSGIAQGSLNGGGGHAQLLECGEVFRLLGDVAQTALQAALFVLRQQPLVERLHAFQAALRQQRR